MCEGRKRIRQGRKRVRLVLHRIRNRLGVLQGGRGEGEFIDIQAFWLVAIVRHRRVRGEAVRLVSLVLELVIGDGVGQLTGILSCRSCRQLRGEGSHRSRRLGVDGRAVVAIDAGDTL